MLNWVVGFWILWAVVNVIMTIGVASSQAYDTAQKLYQVVLIWLVPVFGALVCWYVLREEKHLPRQASESDGTTSDSDFEINFDHGHHGDIGGHGGGDGH
jgi:ABC-type nickel/cobalt efflux system permease component RcnA